MLGPDRHVARLAIAIACSVTIAAPANAAPSETAAPVRPYEGPRGVEVDAAVEPPPPASDPPPPLLLEDDEPIDDDDAQDDEAIEVAEPFDWRDTPEGDAASKKIRGGIILTGGGLLLVFGAAVLGTTDPCRRLAGNGCLKQARTRAALTMGIPGGFVLAAGATLLGLGIAQRRRVKASVLVDVAASRHGGGLSIVGRF